MRGIGGERATGWGKCLAEHTNEADEHVLVIPIMETVRAGQNIEEPVRSRWGRDFPSSDLPIIPRQRPGFKGQWEGPGVAQQLLAIKDTIRRHGKHCGVLPTSNANLIERREQGFRFLGVGMDAGLLLRSMTGAAGRNGAHGTSMSTSLAVWLWLDGRTARNRLAWRGIWTTGGTRYGRLFREQNYEQTDRQTRP